MKILLSSKSFYPASFGGGEIYVYLIAKELIKRGHHLNVLTNKQWDDKKASYNIEQYRYENIPVVSFIFNPDAISSSEMHTSFGRSTSQTLTEIINEFSPDLVHINGMKPALVSLCNELNIPYIATAHHVGIACPAGSLLLPDDTICDIVANPDDCVPCCNYSRRPKWYTGGMLGRIPAWIYRPIGKRLNRSKGLSYFGRGLIYPWLVEQSLSAQKIVVEQAKLIVSPSTSIRDQLIRNGCNPSAIRVIPHGVNPLEKVPFEPFENRVVRFGYIGRINHPKGLHIIFQALNLLSNELTCELHVYGGMQYSWEEEYLDEILNSYSGNSKIFSHGFIPHEKIVEAYTNIDVLIVPSLVPEAFGLVVMEAFSVGRPVIVSNSGALPELVRYELDGFIVERNNSKSLAEAMQKFIDNPELILKMSKNIPHVKTMQEYGDDIEKIYLQL